MSLIGQIEQIKRVHNLIKRKATGTPADLATKLDLSERQVYNIVNLMRDFGAPIFYCQHNHSYCYEEEVHFSFGFFQDDSHNVQGGKSRILTKYLPLQYYFSDRHYLSPMNSSRKPKSG